jgi:hypothetical protein
MQPKIAGSPDIVPDDRFRAHRNVLRLLPGFFEFVADRLSRLQRVASAFETDKALPEETDDEVTYSNSYKLDIKSGASIEIALGGGGSTAALNIKSDKEAERSFEIDVTVTLYKVNELAALQTDRGRVQVAYGARWARVFDVYADILKRIKPGAKSSWEWLREMFSSPSSANEPDGTVLIAVRGEQAAGKTGWLHSLLISTTGVWTSGVEPGFTGEGVRPLWPHDAEFGTQTAVTRTLRVGPLHFRSAWT